MNLFSEIKREDERKENQNIHNTIKRVTMLSSLRKKLNNALQEASIITENLQQQYRQRVTPDVSDGLEILKIMMIPQYFSESHQ